MKTTVLLLLGAASLLTGCATFEPVAYGRGDEGDRYFADGRIKLDRDRDGDGVPNYADPRPNNPLRF